MDAFTKQITLGFAYSVSENVADHTPEQLLWAMDRFHYDRSEIDECAREQRSDAGQLCALELDRRNVPVGNPMLAPAFPRDFPGQRPLVNSF